MEAVDVEDRHPGRERPGQPGLHVRRGGLQHPRHAAGGVGATVEVAQGRADVPGGHPAGVEPRDDALLGLVLQAQELQQERAEQAPTVAGDAHRVARAPDVHGPGAVPVALVAPLGVRREPLAPLVAHQAVEHETPRGTPARFHRGRACPVSQKSFPLSSQYGLIGLRFRAFFRSAKLANLPYFLHPADTQCGTVPLLGGKWVLIKRFNLSKTVAMWRTASFM